MYLMRKGVYICDCCGVEMAWDAKDEHRGDMWECERCGMNFCTKCFVDRLGRDRFDTMVRGGDKVLCHKCIEKEELNNERAD